MSFLTEHVNQQYHGQFNAHVMAAIRFVEVQSCSAHVIEFCIHDIPF